MAEPVIIFGIDGAAVNNRIDWRHYFLPGEPQGRREEQFPGIAERFVVKGGELPPDLVVEGRLEGAGADGDAAVVALIDAMRAANTLKTNGTHTVTIHGRTFADCELVGFVGTSDVLTLDAAEGAKVAREVRYTWRSLRPLVVEEA